MTRLPPPADARGLRDPVLIAMVASACALIGLLIVLCIGVWP